MATVKLVRTITEVLDMNCIRSGNQSDVKFNFQYKDSNKRHRLGSFEIGIDLNKNHYRRLRDSRNGKQWIVETPKDGFRSNAQVVSKQLLKQYAEFEEIIFGSWERNFQARIIPVTLENIVIHDDNCPVATHDRLYFSVYVEDGRITNFFTAKRHARLAKLSEE